MSGAGRWGDLMPRLISAVVMILVGGWAVWRGGVVFDLLIAAAGGGMIWELLRMVAPHRQGGRCRSVSCRWARFWRRL
ncbi:hypothetical protein L0Z64_10450 [Phaeobacter sp. BS23]